MAFDYKKEYKEFYLPPKAPGIVTVPAMNFLAVRGRGDPNEESGAYKQALELFYAVAYTIKMSKMGKHKLEGYFDYVVPPLEGRWWQGDTQGADYSRKADSPIRWNEAGQICFLQEFGCNENRYDPYAQGKTPVFREEQPLWF